MNQLTRKGPKIFSDAIKVRVQGGRGGTGLPKYGGIGGKGGDIYVQGSRRLDRLTAIIESKHCKNGWYTAGDGKPATKNRLLGQDGKDFIIRVPIGVTVSDTENQVLGDINKSMDKICVALGGRGGDKYNDGHGFYGQQRTLKLDLKLISDAVFVGFPNAGKSLLLNQISNARPKVANYPFTTLRPYLGTVRYHDYRQITMTDLPGLIEGANKNIGLGHEFLKHMVRTRVLVFVIDVNDVDLGPNYALRNPMEVLCILNKEIELYDDTLLRKPAILAINKVDSFKAGSEHMIRYKRILEEHEKLRSSEENLQSMKENMRPSHLIEFREVLPISALNNLGLIDLKQAVRRVIDEDEEVSRLEREKFSKFSDIRLLETNRLVQ